MTKKILLQWIPLSYLRGCILMVFICIDLQAQAFNNVGIEKINISIHKLPIRDVFKNIERQTKLFFVYNNNEFDDERLISVVAVNETLNFTLDKIISGTSFKWFIKGGAIILYQHEDSTNIENNVLTHLDSLITISGIIRDEKGNPIPGATVSVKGTRIGTLSDQSGKFILKDIPRKSVVTISSIGYLGQQINADISSGLQYVTMKESINNLNVAVVEAYTTTLRRDVTSSISTISSKDIEKKPVTNLLLALQGEVPGITIQQASGVSNSGISVQIRGINSLAKGSDPLYVVDGVPYTSQLMNSVNVTLGTSGDPSNATFAKQGNPLSFINPADIESISVLKDADATSIYGSRAAAGAIIITTKKGKAGPTRLNLNVQQGWGNVAKFMKLLDGPQYLAMRHEAKVNSKEDILTSDYDLNGTWDTTRNVNWQKELIGGTAKYSDYQLSTSGGSKDVSFLISGGYHRENSVFKTALNNNKGSLHFNLNNSSINDKFHIQLSGSYMADKNDAPSNNLTLIAQQLPPVAPAIYNHDGSLNWAQGTNGASTWINPLAAANNKSTINTINFLSNFQVSYNIFPGLTLKSNFGYNYMQINEVKIFPMTNYAPQYQTLNLRSANYSNGNIKSWIIEPQITYERKIGQGKLETLLGSTLQNNRNYQQVFRGSGYNSDQVLQDPLSASSIRFRSTTATEYKYNAIFGRVNYKYRDRYIINLTARRDGSSRFGSENLFHNFGAIGAAWIFSEEAVFSHYLPFLSFGKLQGSYGTTGNDQIGDYNYLNLFYSNISPVPYQGIAGLYPSGLPNPYLQWEQTKKIQLGVDLGFFESRVFINASYFRNRSSNQLVGYTLPGITGFGSYTRNLPATIQNMGYELSLNTENIKHSDFTWSNKLNIYIPQNKLIAFPGIQNSSFANSYIVGEPITINRVYIFKGVNPETGLYQFQDNKGNLTSSPNSQTDRTKIINTAISLSAGLSNSFTFKGLQLDILLQYQKQLVSGTRFGTESSIPGTMYNQPATVLNRWRKPGDKASAQMYALDNSSEALTAYYSTASSDAQYINTYLLRIKNISLSWNIPSYYLKQAKLQSCQIYVHAQNLFTFTNFIGTDPETGNSGTLPPLRMITVGLQMSL